MSILRFQMLSGGKRGQLPTLGPLPGGKVAVAVPVGVGGEVEVRLAVEVRVALAVRVDVAVAVRVSVAVPVDVAVVVVVAVVDVVVDWLIGWLTARIKALNRSKRQYHNSSSGVQGQSCKVDVIPNIRHGPVLAIDGPNYASFPRNKEPRPR